MGAKTTVALLIVAGTPCAAFDLPAARSVTLQQFVDNPRSFKDQSIRLPRVNCVDEKNFICATMHDGRGIRIKASSLGAGTDQKIAESLIGPCKGTANLDRPQCRFDVIIRPTNVMTELADTSKGSLPIIEVYSMQIEFIRPKP